MTFFLFSVFAFTQEKNTKALRPEDTLKVNSLITESKNYFTSDGAKALSLSIQARDLARSANFPTGEAYAYKNIGITYYYQSKYLEALENYNYALAIFRRLKDNTGVANLLNNIGAIYYDRADYPKALEYYLQSLKYAELVGDKLRMLSVLNNIGGVYSIRPSTRSKALDYYNQALNLCKELNKQAELGSIYANIGAIHFENHDHDKALASFEKSLQAYGNTEGSLNAYNALGKLYTRQYKLERAIENHNKALSLAKKQDNKLSIAQSLKGLGDAYSKQGDLNTAITYYDKAKVAASEVGANDDTKDLYKQMAIAYEKTGDYKNAYKYQGLYSDIKDTIYNIETDKKLGSLQFDLDLQKKEGEIKLLTKDKAIAEANIKREKLVKNRFAISLVLVLLISALILWGYREKVKTNKILDRQKQDIEDLLLNILPVEVAQELQKSGTATPRDYESVAVLFTDFINFTRLTDNLDPAALVKELNSHFVAFDAIIDKYKLEKIKTIGDSYMCAGGIPRPDPDYVHNIIRASLEIIEYVQANNATKISAGLAPWNLRIGIHVGPLVAGVVGKRKFAYDIWGSTVNVASRMESNGAFNRVNISASTYELIKEQFACSYRGKIEAKNVGEIDMYFVDSELPNTISSMNSSLLGMDERKN
jgi:class 3 adenylate cyclase/tetratricopeptide (TPR) repeat protein